MSREELVIKDSEFLNAGKKFKAYCDVLEEVILQYKTTLNSISNTSIPSGATHDAIVRYNEYIARLEIIANGLGEKCDSLVNSFIYDIEFADDYLYDASICNTVRDFSSEEYERLMSILDDPWPDWICNVGEWIYEKVAIICDIFDWDGIKEFLQKAHRLLLEYNDEEKEGLRQLFIDVERVDQNYGISIPGAGSMNGFSTCHFAYITLTLCKIRDMLNTMAVLINPKNGLFTASNIDTHLGKAYKDLVKYYKETLDIKEPGQKPTIPEISDFVSQPWAALYFDGFIIPLSEIVGDITDIDSVEASNMSPYLAYQMIKDKIISGDKIVGNYDEYVLKDHLWTLIQDMAEDYKYSESEEKDIIDDCSTFLKYIEMYGDNWYKYMNSTYGKDGKLLIDGRTKSAKKFKKFLKSFGGAQKILAYGSKGIEYIIKLFKNYDIGIEIIDSFEKNYSGDQEILNAVDQIRDLYNKEVKSWSLELLQQIADIGIDAALEALDLISPVFFILNRVRNGIELVGDVTGISEETKSKYDVLYYLQLQNASQVSYYNALDTFKKADPDSQEYEILGRDLENCFNLNKKNLVELFKVMSKASKGTKKAYYKYCAKQAEMLTMYYTAKPNILSYDEFKM